MKSKFLLIYSPQVFDPKFGAMKPEGSLGLIYLAASLRDKDYEVKVLDTSVGDDNYTLDETFYKETKQVNGMIRIGMQSQDILKEVEPYDVVGITSIFTAQTRMVEEVIRTIKKEYKEKLIVLGGVNARNQQKRFFQTGADLICLSEAEKTIIEIASVVENGEKTFSNIAGLAGKEGFVNPQIDVVKNLDELPIPAWDMQPLEKYWEIARPHGSGFDQQVAYAPVMFSRGCPFKCDYCHISKELPGNESGNLRSLRLKSEGRVIEEIEILKSMGVEYVFIEDDSLLAKKNRAIKIFNTLAKMNLSLADVNGINLAHLCTKINGQIGIDVELMESMAAAGFKKLSFPVESGSQRVLDKYATGKLDLKKHDIGALIKKAKELGMEIGGAYTFGYPDETYTEMLSTFNLARKHIAAGMDYANFVIITPFPGTRFYDLALSENIILPGLDVADMDWMRPSIKTKVPHWFINLIITKGWRYVNKTSRIDRIKSIAPTP